MPPHGHIHTRQLALVKKLTIYLFISFCPRRSVLPVLSASPVSVFFALSHGNTSRIKVEDAIRSTLDEGHKFFRENPKRTVVPAISRVCHADLASRVLFGVYGP